MSDKANPEEVLERIDDGFFAVDEEWQFTYLNERAATVLDVERERVLGESVWGQFEAARGTTFQREYERAIETQESTSFEEYYPPLETWFEVDAYPSESGLSVYFRDVTDRREREQELERYEAIIETVEDGIYVVDDDGRFKMVNQTYADMVGYDRETLVGADVSMVVDAATADRAAAVHERLRTSERSKASMEATLERADGEAIRAEATFSLLPNGDRIGVVRDITHRVERERDLDLYGQVIETVEDGIYVLDPDDQFFMVNDAFCEMTGYDRGELLGRHATAVKDDDVVEEIEAHMAAFDGDEGDAETIRFELETSDGERIPVEDRLNPISFEADVGRCGIVRDISERKERERELSRTRDFLAQTERIAGLGGWEIDVETREVFWTDNLRDMIGRESGAEASLNEALNGYVEADRPKVERAIEAAVASGEAFDIEARFERDDDEIRWLHIQGEPIVEDGEVVSLRGAADDITDRKQFEQRLVALHDVADDLLQVTSEEEIVDRLTQVVSDILNAPAAFFYRREVDEGVFRPAAVADSEGLFDDSPPTVDSDDEGIIWTAFSSGETQHLSDLEASKRRLAEDWEVDGRGVVAAPVSYRGVLGAVSPEADAFEDQMVDLVDLLVTTAATAFSRVEHEGQLRDQRNRLAALNDINSLVYNVAASVFGLSTRDEIERLVCQRLAQTDSYEFAWVGTAEDEEVTVRTELGVEGYLDDITISLEQSPDMDGPTAQAHRTGKMQVVHDVSSDPRYEPWRDRASRYGYDASASVPIAASGNQYGTLNVYSARPNAFSEEERDALRRLGSIVAYAFASVERDRHLQRERNRIEFMNRLLRHNLLNSLNVVEARLEMLEGRVDYEVIDELETAIDRTAGMAEFVETIRKVTRVIGRGGTQELEPKPLDDTLPARVGALRQSYPDVEVHLASVPDVDVVADDLLGEVFDNVLTNAVQHNPSEGPRVWVDVDVHEESVTVSVADDGPGIPDERKERIFDREAKDLDDPGTGFGLYLVKEILDSYGGSITAADNDPEGAVFRLTFQRP